MGSGFAPMRSARYSGSPWALESINTRRALSGDQDGSGVSLGQERSSRSAGQRHEHFLLPGIALGLNQISDPSPLKPRLRRMFAGVTIGGKSRVRLWNFPVPT